jgi:hypothetical protein
MEDGFIRKKEIPSHSLPPLVVPLNRVLKSNFGNLAPIGDASPINPRQTSVVTAEMNQMGGPPPFEILLRKRPGWQMAQFSKSFRPVSEPPFNPTSSDVVHGNVFNSQSELLTSFTGTKFSPGVHI